MGSDFKRLLSAAGDSLLPPWTVGEERAVTLFGENGKQLLDLLRQRNGFFAFESSLHVFPLGSSLDRLTLIRWNDPHLWKNAYGELLGQPVLFFAQDVNGNQFGISNQKIILFYSEFAEFEVIAGTLSEWEGILMSDWRGFTGYELAHEWQTRHRSLEEGERLIPKVPFVVGGKYEVNNLYAGQIIDAMRFRASLALQIAAVPDGTAIRLTIT